MNNWKLYKKHQRELGEQATDKGYRLWLEAKLDKPVKVKRRKARKKKKEIEVFVATVETEDIGE